MHRILNDRWLTPILLVYALAVALWPLATGIQGTIEDGFYYLKIAENLARGAGSTFDGQNPTNGYHPLWLLCLVPLFFVASDAQQVLTLSEVLQAALAALAAGVFYGAARFLLPPAASALAVLLWIALTHRLWLNGLEYALYSLALAVTLYVHLRWFGAAAGRARLPRAVAPFLLLGLGCAATFLTRLDSLPLTAILALALAGPSLRAGPDRAALRRLGAFAAVPIVAALAYAGISLGRFDHAIPVSAAVKRSWSEELEQRDASYRERGWLVQKGRALAVHPIAGWKHWSSRPLALGLAGAGIWLAVAVAAMRSDPLRRWFDVRLRPLGPWIGYGLLAYLGYTLLYYRGLSLSPWYYAIQPMLGTLVAGALLERFAERLAAIRGARAGVAVLAAAFAVALLQTAHGLLALRRADRQLAARPLRDAAGWVSRNLPRDARIASWNPAMIAYLSGRQVVNLDGLVNSWEFFEKERHDLCGYWRKSGVSHLVDIFRNEGTGGEAAIMPLSPVSIEVRCPESLELLWRDDRYAPEWSVRAYRLRLDRESGAY